MSTEVEAISDTEAAAEALSPMEPSRLLAERRPAYELADIRVFARRGDSIEQTTNRVIEAIAAHDPAILEAE